MVTLKTRVLAAVDANEDSVRFYFLGEDKAPKVEHYGTKRSLDLDGPLIV